jgi:hypothetical protein
MVDMTIDHAVQVNSKFGRRVTCGLSDRASLRSLLCRLFHKSPQPESIKGILERRLSRIRMIGSSYTPPPHSPVSKLDRRHTRRLRKRDNLLIGEGKGWGRRQIIRLGESLVLYNNSLLSVLNVYTNVQTRRLPMHRFCALKGESCKLFQDFFFLQLVSSISEAPQCFK